MIRNENEMELRTTYWKCKDCKKIYLKANIDRDIVTCPVCASTDVLPVTIFKLVKVNSSSEKNE